MSGRGRPPKRKLEGCQGQRTAAKEARMESITVEVTDAGHLTLVTLTPSDFTHVDPLESTHQRLVEDLGEVSELVMWRGGAEGDNHTPTPQISLGCMRTPNGTQQDCSTQTYHFTPCDLPPTSSTRPVLESPRARRTTALPGISLESIKVEIGEQDYLNHPLVCCVSGCVSQSDLLATDGQRTVFYTLPHSLEDKESWAASLDITLCVGPEDKDEHVCSHHFLSPTKVTPTATTTNSGTTTFKNKKGTRKKKTCDMLIAEEAERIRQGLGGGRPKRTPKPNKNYDWAEIAPLIKADPDDFDDADLDYPVYPMDRLPPPGSQKTPLFPGAVKHENKENAAPGSVVAWIDGEDGEEEEDEETVEEYGPDVSLPTSPRAPPPKPKGRPHRIRDNCCQTETDHKPVRAPLREVRVQCGLSASSNSACSACAHIDWRRLEELLVAVLKGVEDGGEQWWREVRECVGVVLDTASPHTPSHPTNVLKLLRGEDRHPLESDKGIVLVAGQEGEEVEIENVIHPEVEEPISGMREITPGTWSRNKSLKKQKYPGPVRIKTIDPEDDQDIDRLGLAEATEKDEDEFQPGLGAEDEDEEDMEEDIEEEEEEEGDDEDWDIKKGDETKPKKKKRRLQKIKKVPWVERVTSHELEEDDVPLDPTSRRCLAQLDLTLPEIISSHFEYHSLPQEGVLFVRAVDPQQMPPTEELEPMMRVLSDCPDSFVSLGYGDFALEDLQKFKEFHNIIKLRRELCEEEKFFTGVRFSYNPLKAPENIENILGMIQNHSEDYVLEKELPGHFMITVKELKSLTCQRWLSDVVIMKYFDLFEWDEFNCQTFALYLNSILEVEAYVSLLKEFYPGIQKFVLTMCVRLEKLSNGHVVVYLGGKDLDMERGTPVIGNHFTFCTYDLEAKKLCYFDTLGYPLPENLLDNLDEIVSGYRIDLQGDVLTADIIMAHEFTGYGNPHKCTSNCSIYPHQTCSNVCGPAVLMGTTIAVQNPRLLELLVSTKRRQMNLVSQEVASFRHFLPNFSPHSKEIRFAVMSWLMEGKIDINNILQDNTVETYTKNVEKYSEIKEHMPKKVMHDKYISEVIRTKMVYKGKKNKRKKLLIKGEMGEDSDILELIPEHMRVFLSKTPTLVMEQGKAKTLVLGVYVKGSDKPIIKRISCSARGRQCKAATKLLKDYVHSQDFEDKVKEKYKEENVEEFYELLKSNAELSLVDLISVKPQVSYLRASRKAKVTFFLKNSQFLYKYFKSSGEGDGEDALSDAHAFVQSQDAIELIKRRAADPLNIPFTKQLKQLLTKTPRVIFCKPNKLRLTCHLKSGKSITRQFQCSSEGMHDTKATLALQSFLQSSDCLDWISNHLECVSIWTPAGEVAVGLETKNYFDQFGFDFRKSITLASGVRAVYQGSNTMKVSVTENKKWGRTHRFDETYEFEKQPETNKVFPAVRMYITCSSRTSACRAQCKKFLLRDLNSSEDISPHERCPGCNEDLAAERHVCFMCATEVSPSWYLINGQDTCNACYLYQRKYNTGRPVKPRPSSSSVPKTYHPHYLCGWKLKFEVYSDNLKVWKIFTKTSNDEYHQEPIIEITKKRPSLSTRDLWDQLRVLTRAKPKQILTATNKQGDLHVGDEEEVPQGNIYSLKQVQNRLRFVDVQTGSTPGRDRKKKKKEGNKSKAGNQSTTW